MNDVGGVSGLGGATDSLEGPFLGPLKPLLVPLRFLTVALPVNVGSSSAVSSHSVYKGGFPRRRNLPFLSRLRLKTIVSLTPKPLDALEGDVTQWAKSNNISLVHVKCEKPKDDGGGLSKEAAAKALMVRLWLNNYLFGLRLIRGHFLLAHPRLSPTTPLHSLLGRAERKHADGGSPTESTSLVHSCYSRRDQAEFRTR
jgi:hypothetical protein